jgi:hypothetical protein
MQKRKARASENKSDFRNDPSANLSDSDVRTPAQKPQMENSSDPRRLRSGPES